MKALSINDANCSIISINVSIASYLQNIFYCILLFHPGGKLWATTGIASTGYQ
jgi:hypothetical protein